MTTATQMLDVLTAWNVSHVFCCPGTTETPILDALARPEVAAAAPRFVLTTHEAVSVSMADGYARASGDPGVAYLHTNVGVANGLAHTYAAQLARSSVALLTGIKGTATLPHRALTTSPRLLETAGPYTLQAAQNLREEDLVEDIDRTLWRCTVAPEGPTLLTIPQDHISSRPTAVAAAGPRPAAKRRPAAEAVDRAAELLTAATRVAVVAGSDVARRGAEASLESVAEALGAPVYVESRRDLERWAFRTDHPHFAGLFEASDAAVRDADLIFLAGMPTPLEFSSARRVLPEGAAIVHLAEDEAEPGRRGSPAATLVGDTALGLEDLASAVAGREAGRSREFLRRAREEHDRRLRAWREEVPASGETQDFSAARAMRVLAECVPDEAVLVLDAVTSTLPLLRFLERPKPDTLFATASGSLGWGLGAAAGIALARDERALAVVGDGVVQFGVPAFWTVARYRIPVTYLVVRNGKYQAVVSGLVRAAGDAHQAGRYPLTDLGEVDIAGIAESFGILAVRVSGAASLRDALAADSRLTASDGPRLIEVTVNDVLWQ